MVGRLTFGTGVVPTLNSVRTESMAIMNQNERDRVLALYRTLLEARNKRNADRFAAAFAEDGSSAGLWRWSAQSS